MLQPVIDRLVFLCDTIPAKIRQLSNEALADKPAENKWSKKEILGHLIDSAANNHQRFVRGQVQDQPVIFYEQDSWVRVQNYQQEAPEILLLLWEAYNRHLAHMMTGIPEEALSRPCRGGDQKPVTLRFLMDDYVLHLEHHLKQIVSY